jgi:GNAT superfamily N-acetyltransferase
MNTPTWIEATSSDASIVLGLMEAFYAEERLAFSTAAAELAVNTLLTNAGLGRVFLLTNLGSAHTSGVHGHLVLTWGFSLEFGGRYVLLDELYLKPALRGQGWGRSGIELAARWARDQGANSLRLEVNRTNAHARDVYLRRGFRDDGRDLFTRWLSD